MGQKIALVGAGSIGTRHLKAMRQTDTVTLAAIVDPVPDAAALAQEEGVPFFSDTQPMLEQIHPAGVIIATPTEHHLAPSLAALAHGSHVLIEKPIAATNAEADQIIAACAQTGRHALIAHQRRYYPQVEQARDIVQGGAIGQLVGVSGLWAVRKHQEYYAADWRKRWPASPILTNLVHELDYLRYICGPILAITAEVNNAVLGYEKDDTAATIISFANGAIGTFLMTDQADSPWSFEQATGENALFPPTGENVIRFVGTKGGLDFPNLRLWTSDGDPQWMTPMSARDMPNVLGDAYVRQLDHFADVMTGKAAPRIDARDGAGSLAATLAVFDSARTHGRVIL